MPLCYIRRDLHRKSYQGLSTVREVTDVRLCCAWLIATASTKCNKICGNFLEKDVEETCIHAPIIIHAHFKPQNVLILEKSSQEIPYIFPNYLFLGFSHGDQCFKREQGRKPLRKSDTGWLASP